MAHWAKIENGIVTQVIVAEHDVIESGLFGNPWMWLQTSYNTRGGVHYGPDGEPDGGTPLRKNYAAIGYSYDRFLDAFIPPKPFPSWVLNENSCLWDAPIPYPNDGKAYVWDEASLSWLEQPEFVEGV